MLKNKTTLILPTVTSHEEYPFHSSKGFRKLISITGNAYSVKDLS